MTCFHQMHSTDRADTIGPVSFFTETRNAECEFRMKKAAVAHSRFCTCENCCGNGSVAEAIRSLDRYSRGSTIAVGTGPATRFVAACTIVITPLALLYDVMASTSSTFNRTPERTSMSA